MELKESLLRLQAVECRTGLRKSKLYALMNAGEFPRPIELTTRTRGWLESEVDRWIQDRIRASRAQGQAA